MSWKQASAIFNVSTGSITKWLKNKRETGSVCDSPAVSRKPRKIDPSLLISAFEERPDATLAEIAKQFNCWPQSIHKRCVKLGITRKKNNSLQRKKRRKKTSVHGGD